jgi:hypothetical protein
MMLYVIPRDKHDPLMQELDERLLQCARVEEDYETGSMWSNDTELKSRLESLALWNDRGWQWGPVRTRAAIRCQSVRGTSNDARNNLKEVST